MDDLAVNGLIIVKPFGVKNNTHNLVDNLFNSENLNNNSIFNKITSVYEDSTKERLKNFLIKSTVKFTYTIDTKIHEVIWDMNYPHLLQDKGYELLKRVIRGNAIIYFINYTGEDADNIEELLKLLKGKNKLVKHNDIIREGAGIRGLDTFEAQIIDAELLKTLIYESKNDVLIKSYDEFQEDGVGYYYRYRLPKIIEDYIFDFMPEEDNLQVIKDSIHTTADQYSLINTYNYIKALSQV